MTPSQQMCCKGESHRKIFLNHKKRQGEEETLFYLNEMLVERNRAGKKVEPREQQRNQTEAEATLLMIFLSSAINPL